MEYHYFIRKIESKQLLLLISITFDKRWHQYLTILRQPSDKG